MMGLEELRERSAALEDYELTLTTLMHDAYRDGEDWLGDATSNLILDVRCERKTVDLEIDILERAERNVMNREYERMVL